jgi:hypothetical protein
MHPIMDALFLKHVASSLDKQLRLQDLIGEDTRWQSDLETGTLSFGGGHTFAIQVLGSESELDGTWLWSWANAESNLPGHLVEAANALKSFGEKKQVPELTQPSLPIGELDGHKLSMIASGACHSNAYYRGPYDGGAIFLLIKDASFPSRDKDVLWNIARTFTQVVANFPVNHRKAFVEYLRYYELEGEGEGSSIGVHDSEGRMLVARFDDAGRLLKIEGDVGAPPAKKPRKKRRARRRRR